MPALDESLPSTLLDEAFLDQAWCLSPAVALRPEPFGALAYHFGNRKLTFLKRPELVRIVQALAEHPNARSTLVDEGIPVTLHAAYTFALKGLAATDMIRPRAGENEAVA